MFQLFYCVSQSWHSISSWPILLGKLSTESSQGEVDSLETQNNKNQHAATGEAMPLHVQKPWYISPEIPALLSKPSRRPWRKNKETTISFSLRRSATCDLRILPKPTSFPWNESHLNRPYKFKVAIKVCVTKQISVWLGSGLALSTGNWMLTHREAVCLKVSSALYSECP